MDGFKKTQSQKETTRLIAQSKAKEILVEGGSRSGKSFLIARLIIIRASRERSDHLICRETFNAAKRSLWQKTIPDVFRICFPNLAYKSNNTDYFIELPNGSRIFIAGLDDGAKVERLLGNEYSTLWINEANQVSYNAIVKLKTRLAQKNNLKKVTYYDQNPTKTTSHIYQTFHQKVNALDGEMLSDPENYLALRMNPEGNIENLDPDYIKMLESLPEKERKRFLLGEYDDSNSGAAVYSFDRDQHVSLDAVKLSGTNWVGSDFNIDYNSDVLASQHANGLYIYDESQIAGDTFMKADALKRNEYCC
jgi:PBSX family phage terminase large subunit